MSVNKYQPHVFVLPEDDANRQLVRGFVLHERLGTNQIQVLPPAGGWMEVVGTFLRDHVRGMETYGDRVIVLLLDFDGDADRATSVKARIPQHLLERVFVLGVSTEPEDLKKSGLGTYETIGLGLAQDCYDGTENTWGHSLLRRNLDESARLRAKTHSILFRPTW